MLTLVPLQVIEEGISDPVQAAAKVAHVNAELAEDEWPGVRPPRKRQKCQPGEPQVRLTPYALLLFACCWKVVLSQGAVSG